MDITKLTIKLCIIATVFMTVKYGQEGLLKSLTFSTVAILASGGVNSFVNRPY